MQHFREQCCVEVCFIVCWSNIVDKTNKWRNERVNRDKIFYEKYLPAILSVGPGINSIQLNEKSPFSGLRNSTLMAFERFAMAKFGRSFQPALNISTYS